MAFHPDDIGFVTLPPVVLPHCDLWMLWPTAARKTGRVAASYITSLAARNPELPRPAGMGSFNKQEKLEKWKGIAKTSIRMLFECSYLFHFLLKKEEKSGD